MLADGGVDWDQVFDAADTGLIARIETAASAKDLQQAMQLILKTLFNRDGDEHRRAAFTNIVNEILSHAKATRSSTAAAMAEVKTRVIQILQSIKEDRQKRARKALAARARKAKEEGKSTPTGRLGYDDRQSDDVHIKIPSAAKLKRTTPIPIAAPPEDEWIGDQDEDSVTPEESVAGEPAGEKSSVGETEEISDAPHSDLLGETLGEGQKLPDEFYSDVIITSIMDNMETIRGNLNMDGAPETPPPFILSPAFAEQFAKVVRDHVLPGFVEGSYVTIANMTAKPRSQWLDVLRETFGDPSQGLMMWERWQVAWLDATTQREEPSPPVVDPAKQGVRGLMTRLLGDEDHFIPDEEMTQEEWQEAVDEARQENSRAKQVWSQLTSESSDYQAPVDADNHLLMGLFRSMDDLEGHIAKLRQLAKEGENAGRAFDAYHPGKDLDIPLLAACYRYPDEFLRGEKTMVANFVAGLDRKRGMMALPLCCRYLGSAMGNRFSKD